MNKKSIDMICFSSIELSEPIINKKNVKAKVILNKLNGGKKDFTIILKYQDEIKKNHLPLLRLAFIMPLLNYGLFSYELKLNFPLSKKDLELVTELNNIFSKDIFVNKIINRRANFILSEYLPDETNIKSDDAKPKAKINSKAIYNDEIISKKINSKFCGILSSGGKESLLTYGLLKELRHKVYPLYVNESGGHWRTALSAYRYHKTIDPDTQRVWTNVDQFYNFMLDNLIFIRPDHRKIYSDSYPIRLCIFPFYVFLMLPIFIDKNIGNLLIGSEFDDLRSTPEFFGIVHYFGVYDQHQDYDILMNNWYNKRIPGLIQWSAVRNISGLIVERVLINRYPYLAKYQRSCHSCHIENREIIPCGHCSKCMGILLFLLANKADPKIMNYKEKDIISFSKRVVPSNLRLDQDEKNQSFFLLGKKDEIPEVKPIEHIEKIHINKSTCDIKLIPVLFRSNLLKILENYSTGYCELVNDKWVSIKNYP